MSEVWSWIFAGPKEVRQALEEYTSFQDGTLCRHYGHDGLRVAVDELGREILDEDGREVLISDPEPPTNPAELAKLQMSKARIRSEIDASMEVLRRTFPHWYRLLDVYFRQGCSMEPRGWLVPAILLGVHKGRCPLDVRCPVSPGDNRPGRDECQRAAKKGCRWDRETFERQVTCAVARLYDAHKGRSGRTS
jgi:hypothetical protein